MNKIEIASKLFHLFFSNKKKLIDDLNINLNSNLNLNLIYQILNSHNNEIININNELAEQNSYYQLKCKLKNKIQRQLQITINNLINLNSLNEIYYSIILPDNFNEDLLSVFNLSKTKLKKYLIDLKASEYHCYGFLTELNKPDFPDSMLYNDYYKDLKKQVDNEVNKINTFTKINNVNKLTLKQILHITNICYLLISFNLIKIYRNDDSHQLFSHLLHYCYPNVFSKLDFVQLDNFFNFCNLKKEYSFCLKPLLKRMIKEKLKKSIKLTKFEKYSLIYQFLKDIEVNDIVTKHELDQYILKLESIIILKKIKGRW